MPCARSRFPQIMGRGGILRAAWNPAEYAVENRAVMIRTVLPTAVWYMRKYSEGTPRVLFPRAKLPEERVECTRALPALQCARKLTRLLINAPSSAAIAPTNASGSRSDPLNRAVWRSEQWKGEAMRVT
ncbi:unnamed protein product [Lasius platythorax]|uniref:Uncharacterized protein n=1 Tax=Lasius platythorax TaxID=488582 RepID=A0AAV2NU68_9HYME